MISIFNSINYILLSYMNSHVKFHTHVVLVLDPMNILVIVYVFLIKIDE